MKPYLLAGAAVVASVGLAFAVTPPHSRVIAPGALNPDVTQASIATSPGALNPDVTQATIATTICVSGWTATVRPPAAYTTALKRRQIAALRLKDANPQDYEEDHRVPIGSAGDPRSILNLWPEGYERTGTARKGYGSESKDRLEDYIHRQICSGKMTLKQAQTIWLGDYFQWRDQHLGKGA